MISIIDDDLFVRVSTSALISSLGHEALIFDSGEQFLASGCLKDTRCIRPDLHMPGWSVLAWQGRLLREGPGPPIILSRRIRKKRLGHARSMPARWLF